MENIVSKNNQNTWKDKVRVLYSEEILQKKVEELGAMVSADYAGRIPILVAVLKGSFIFIADLCRKITIPVIFDFMAVSSYGDSMASSGVVRISKDLDYSIENRDVLIIEDIIDSGRTLNYLVKNIKARNPRSVEICALFDKDVPGKFKNKIKYKGFDIPNKFVVGYGLDFAENYRNLPFIGYIENTE